MYAPAQANVEVDDVCPVIAEWNVCCVCICTITGQQVPQSVTGHLSVSFSLSLTSRVPAGKAAEGHMVRLTPPFKRSRYGFVRVVLCCEVLPRFGHSVKHLLSTFTEVQSECRGIRGCSRWLQNLSISLKHIYLEVKRIHFMVILLRLPEPSENEAKPQWTHYHSWSQALCLSNNVILDAMQFAQRCGQQQLELNVG